MADTHTEIDGDESYDPTEEEIAAMQTDPRLDGPDDDDAPAAAPPAPAPAVQMPPAAETPTVAAATAPVAMTTTPAAPPPAKAETSARWHFAGAQTDGSRLTVHFSGPSGSAAAEQEARRLRREAEEAVRDSEAFKAFQAADKKVAALNRPIQEQRQIISDIQGKLDGICDPNDLQSLMQAEVQAKGLIEFGGRALGPALRERTDAARAVWLEAKRIAELKQMEGMRKVEEERREAGRLLAAVQDALDRLTAADYLCGLMSGMWAFYNGPAVAGSLVGPQPPPPVRAASPRSNAPPWVGIMRPGEGLPGTFEQLAAVGSVPQIQATPATAEALAAAQRQANEAVRTMNGGGL